MLYNITLKTIKDNPVFSKITSAVIIFCAVIVGIETAVRNNTQFSNYLLYLDYLILLYFTFELLIRLASFSFSKEEIFWLFFDGLILIFSLLSLFESLFTHPEIISTLRIFRIFRVLRVFELNESLKKLEKKIFSVVPTVFIFAFLLCLIIYVYSIIGMHLYDYKKFQTLDFSNLYVAFTSLFVIITNGWASTLNELKEGTPSLSPFITDIYIFSYFIFSVMVTFNVFIAVMTSQIQDKLKDEIDEQYKILTRIEGLEIKIQSNIQELEKTLLKKIEHLKNN
jgi:voltage-gated sodium channel